MPKHGSLRLLLAVAASVAAFVGCPSREAVKPMPVTYPVKVGPSENQVSPDPQPISKVRGDRVSWTLIDKTGQTDASRKLFIEFERPDAFSAVTLSSSSKRFRVSCNGAGCQSGPISGSAVEGNSYKYWQIVVDPDGTEHPADGHIIINH